jgi:hypothetical protein
MEIEFSQHAFDELKNRGIKKRLVIDVLTKPDEIQDSYRGRRLYRKSYSQDMLEVVVKEEDNKLVVITAYILDGMS